LLVVLTDMIDNVVTPELRPPCAVDRLVDAWRTLGPRVTGGTDDPRVAAAAMRALVAAGALDLPLPGSGRSRERLRVLSRLGELDLTVGRLGEAHADAMAISAELGGAAPGPDEIWGVWAAEPPTARVTAAAPTETDDSWRLDGRKAWCSGAGIASHALVTAHAADGPRLFAVDLASAGVAAVDDPWPVAALRGSDTRSVDFTSAVAVPVGGPGQYVGRPGFWHGAVSVAAVWYGGAVGVARAMQRAHERRPLDDVAMMHLGGLDAGLSGARAALDAAAAAFDTDPSDRSGHAAAVARRTRAVVEAAATETVDRVGRALGAAPLALDGDHARRVADLQLYLRQSHADRDLVALGRLVAEHGEDW
jgi:alkylation response protein AidB-like acyl-CoA dehydrogenase